MSTSELGIGDCLAVGLACDNAKQLYVDTSKGAPYISINVGAAVRKARYAGTHQNKILFTYAIQAADPDGAITQIGLVLNNAVITNELGSVLSDVTLPAAALDNLGLSSVASDGTAQRQQRPGIEQDIAETLGGVASSSLYGALNSGIGDGADLSVKVEVDHLERWLPRIHKGWFYIGDKEYYLFAKKHAVSSSPYLSGSVVYLQTPDYSPDYDITKVATYGPVIVKSYDNDVTQRLVQVSSASRVIRELASYTQIVGTTLRKYSVEGIPHELYREDAKTKMRSVSSRDMVTDSLHYTLEYNYDPTYETEDGTIIELVDTYVVVAGDDPVFVTYAATDVVKDPDSPWDPLIQEEICKVDSSNKIRVMYRDVSQVQSVYPVVTVLQNGVRTEVAPTAIALNVLTLPSTFGNGGTISPGDLVGVRYYVNNSYALIDTSDVSIGVKAYTYPERISSLIIEYEGSPSEYWDGVELLPGSNSYVQLNPVKDGVFPGFLYIVEATTQKLPTNLALFLSSDKALVNGTVGQPIDVLAVVLDSDGNPIQDEPLILSAESFVTGTRGVGTDVIPNVPFDAVVSRIEYAGASVTGYNPPSVVANGSNYDLQITWAATAVPRGKTYKVFFTTSYGEFMAAFPRGATTDWNGHMRTRWIPSGPCSTIISVQSRSVTGLCESKQLLQLDIDDLQPRSLSTTVGKDRVWIRVTNDAAADGSVKVLAYVSDISGALPAPGVPVTFVTRCGKFKTSVPIQTNIDGIAVNYYAKADGDHIYAKHGETVSNLIVIGESNDT